MALSGISVGTQTPTTLTGLQSTFANARADQNLRFSDAKGLHTHGSLELTKVDFLAKFRNAGALQERADLRRDAIAQIKTAIDNEYGAGMGERVFAEADRVGIGQDSVKVSDLQRFSNTAEDIQQRDIAAANARLGDDNHIGDLLQRSGLDFSSLSRSELDLVKHQMASAVLDADQGLSGAQCGRLALAVPTFAMAERSTDQLGSANFADRMGLGNHDRADLKALTEKCFAPVPPLAQNASDLQREDHQALQNFSQLAPGDLAKKIVSQSTSMKTCADGKTRPAPNLPTIKTLNLALQVDGLATASKADKARAINEAIGGETTKACQAGNPEKTFLRANSFPLPFELVNVQFKPQFEARMPAVAQELLRKADGSQRTEPLAVRAVDLTAQADPAAAAAEAFRSFDRGMEAIFGGSDTAAMRAAAQQVPQDVCDLLAAAHKAVRTEAAKANIAPDVVASLIRSTDINFLSLRNLGPMLNEVPTENAAQGNSMKSFSKFYQNCANGINSAANAKEPIPPGAYVAGSADPISTKWIANIDVFVTEVASRGQSPI